MTDAQKILLKQAEEMYKGYVNELADIEYLKLMLNLFADPDIMLNFEEQIIGENGVGRSVFGMFRKFSIQNVMRNVLSLVKNKETDNNGDLPKFKGVIEKLKEVKEKTGFNIEPVDLSQIRINLAKRKSTKYNNSNSVPDFRSRVVRSQSGVSFSRNPIVFKDTILKGIKAGNYNLERHELKINSDNLMRAVYESHVTYNIMIVLDVSNSIKWVIPVLERIIPMMSSRVASIKDRIGLIGFQNDMARVYHYPTHNSRLIIGSINDMKIEGMTPIADGLNLAGQVFTEPRYKAPGFKNMIVLISDCYPEPITGKYENMLDEPSYKAVEQSVKLLDSNKISLMIINPVKPVGKIKWGKKLVEKLQEYDNVKYVELDTKYSTSMFGEDKALIKESEIQKVCDSMLEVKVSL